MYREELRPIVQVMRRDEEARYMWLRIHTEETRDLFVAVCYFAPAHSSYACPRGQSPYTVLDEDIMEFARDGDRQ